MALYEVTSSEFRRIDETDFNTLLLKERSDLQRLLRKNIAVIADDLYVLAEEFSEWEDSRRRIDLLALDSNANLVVIELKRSNDGGAMELQATRYAAMVSALGFERTVQIHADFLQKIGDNPLESQARIVEFLDWEEPDEEAFATDTRIILVSADFSRELTTSVLWLRDHDVDIRCVRLRPYKDGDRIFVDAQQIIPLPEATEYQVQLREKETEGRKQRAERYDLRHKFWEGVVRIAREKGEAHGNLAPTSRGYIGSRSGIRGLGFNLAVKQDSSKAELYIDRGNRPENKAIFDQLSAHRQEIEAELPFPLEWQRLDNRRACRIKAVVQGGYRSPQDAWPAIHKEMLDRMIGLERTLRPYLDALRS